MQLGDGKVSYMQIWTPFIKAQLQQKSLISQNLIRPTLLMSNALTSNSSNGNGSELAFTQANKGKHLELDLRTPNIP